MRHDWIFDVLTDLQSYALKNGLPRLAAQAEQTLHIARAEIAAERAADAAPEPGQSQGGIPPGGRPN